MADLSGFLVGSAEDFQAYREGGDFKAVAEEIQKAFAYAERPDRFLYGSDWSLAPMSTYSDFIREVIPEEYQDESQQLPVSRVPATPGQIYWIIFA